MELGEHRPKLIQRLERRIDSAGDVEFSAIAEVLRRLGRFHTPARPGAQIDRWRSINLAAGKGPESTGLRLLMLNGLILDGRDNAHARRGLRLAAGDAEPEVRAASAVLAAKLGDEGTLAELLADADAQVRAAAAIDAALAGRKGCIEKIAGIFAKPETDAELAAAAFALARLAPAEFAAPIAGQIEKARQDDKQALLEQLLYVATLLDKRAVGPAVVNVFRSAQRGKTAPPAMALVAAGRLRLHAARRFVVEPVFVVLRRDRDKLTVRDAQTLAAATNAARRFGMLRKLYAACMKMLWHPGTSQAMIFCAEALTVPASASPASGDGLEEVALAPAEAVEILRRAAAYAGTPVPSAAAAVALFKLAPDEAEEALRIACGSETWLAGDYVAWNLARAGRHRRQATRIAAKFIGPEVYDKGVRTAGAILLASLARGTDQAGRVADAIEGRLRRQRDRFAAGSYQCALLTLGRGEYAADVAELVRSDAFPKRRALTALLLAGEPAGFDLVFGAERLDAARIDSFLTGRLMARVYAAVAADLPGFDMDAPRRVRHWQCQILRDFYLIHRPAILAKMRQ